MRDAMSNDSEHPQSHLAWRIQPKALAIKNLQRSGCRELPSTLTQDNVAVLYVYGSKGSPKALTWEPYRNDTGGRLMREATTLNRFDAWFESNRDANVWTIAAVWRFYRDWVVGYNVPHWQSCLQKQFSVAPLLDEVFAVSRGWILWDFQVELLCKLAIENASDARRVAEMWRLQNWREEDPSTGIVLADGSSLIGILHERSWKERHGAIMSFGDPDLRLAYAIQAAA
jgi:hypothetical protein